MSTPVEIDFQGMEARPAVREAVNKQIAQFERRFGPISAGRVVLKSPGRAGQASAGEAPRGRYEVNIALTLPDGRNFLVGGRPSDKRYADLDYAISDAFKCARTAAL